MTVTQEMLNEAKNDRERKILKEIFDLDAKMRDAAQRLAAERGNPKVIDQYDQKALSENIQAIIDGTAIVVDTKAQPRKLADNEILASDRAGLMRNFDKIASGEMVVVHS